MTDQVDPAIAYYYASGKLLLAGEYFVLDGATAFSLPTQLGQSLQVFKGEEAQTMHWQSLDHTNQIWLDIRFHLPDLSIKETTDQEMAERLQAMLLAARAQNRSFLTKEASLLVQTRLEFDRTWGLGSSSTLLHLLGQWSQTDPFAISDATLGGSGYDIATAGAKGAIWYRRKPDRWFTNTSWHPAFLDQLYFVYLNQKMNSREGIRHYRQAVQDHPEWMAEADQRIRAMVEAKDIDSFESAVRKHEVFTSQALQMQPVQERLFADYWGTVKSLGAWGGDFVLITSNQPRVKTQAYFNDRGFEVFFPYKDLIK
ncbi:MAG: GYDIA family GHMP kinase [Bacteroidota bacterium]